MGFITHYLSKLLASGERVDGLVFSGGIGEKSDYLRADVAKRLGWVGLKVDDVRNGTASKGKETVSMISADGSKVPMWVVLTDEEGVCAEMCKDKYGL
jgi:acetate kinase